MNLDQIRTRSRPVTRTSIGWLAQPLGLHDLALDDGSPRTPAGQIHHVSGRCLRSWPTAVLAGGVVVSLTVSLAGHSPVRGAR